MPAGLLQMTFLVLLGGIILTGQRRDAEWYTNKLLKEEKLSGRRSKRLQCDRFKIKFMTDN